MLSKADRKAIEASIAAIENALEAVNEIFTEQQEKFDTMSEKAQDGPKGEALSTLLGYLEEATNGVESGISALYSVLDVEP
jgi:t-SNARE complex subunit (syntaxin)